MRVALAQLNPIVGDYAGNTAMILDAADQALAAGATVLVTPELALCGYPPRDLLDRPAFVDDGLAALEHLRKRLAGIEVVVGFVDRVDAPGHRDLRNSAAVIRGGRVVEVRHKRLLPTYDVFDEDRWFGPADSVRPATIAGASAALTVCEDSWSDSGFWPDPAYGEDPVSDLVAAGATWVVNISASPYRMGKAAEREAMLRATAMHHGVPVLYCNQVGGNDELLFDGCSLFIDATGQVRARGASFETDLVICDLADPAASGPTRPAVGPVEEEVRLALCMGLRDYVRKCGFSDVLLGLSGGIDSALVCALAVEALGPEHVMAVAMPSRYSSEGSVSDAKALAGNLGIQLAELSIEGPFSAFLKTLEPAFEGLEPDVTEENLQARIRGALLMALSNKHGSLLLTTGNKSELAVGYCTLYGDMNGGLAMISDLPKTLVYRIAGHLRDASGERVIPESTLTKAPSAELAPGQLDQDRLPPYELLDEILDGYVVRERSAAELIGEGLDEATVRRVIRMVNRNEYKRRQAAPGLRVTTKAFGMGRRVPIACRLTRVP